MKIRFKTNTILSVYAVAKSEGRISILGALSNDYYSFEPEVQAELKILTDNTLNWLTDTLKDGKKEGFSIIIWIIIQKH